MLWPLTVLLLSACGDTREQASLAPADRPAGFVDPQLTTTGASPVLQLWRTPGDYELPDTPVPEELSSGTGRIRVHMDPGIFKVRRATNLYRGPSPFKAAEEEGRVAAPPGMSLYVGDEKAPYNQNMIGKGWRITQDTLLVAWPGDLPPVTIVFPEAQRQVERHHFVSAGMSPEDFVHEQITLDARTRPGLMLPAPAAATWDVTLPASEPVTFEGWLAVSPLPLRSLTSDGLQAVLEVEADGQVTEVDRRDVEPREQFVEWRADLSRWAGRQVKVRLRAQSTGSPDFDYLFVGTPAIWGAATGPVRRVVVIGIDTTRPDHFGSYGYARDTTPELDAVAETATVFDRTWAPAPRTRPSFRTAFTGRRPLDAVGAKNIGAVFQDHGFATAGIVANVHLQPRFEFHEGFGDWWYDGQAKADAQVDRAIGFLERYPDRDTYLFLHVMDPHLFYNAPPAYKDMFAADDVDDLPPIFNRWEVYGWMRTGRLDEHKKAHIAARYDGELRFTSAELGRLFAALDRMPGKSLVVLHSDHGEELWDHDGFEHNHTVYDEVTRVLLWFRSGPGQAQGVRNHTPVTLADIAPTLFDFAGFGDAPPTDGKSLVPLLSGADDGASWGERPLGVAHLRYGKERWGVVVRDHKYILHTASGEEELYDLAADPGEHKNLAPTVDLEPYRAALAEAHGMAVGRGWRVDLQLSDEAAAGTWRIALPAPAREAGVIDPEATIEDPANQAWGEKPRKTPEDIGVVTLSDDGRTVAFTPGPKPSGGILYVLFDEDVDPAGAELSHDGVVVPTAAARPGVVAGGPRSGGPGARDGGGPADVGGRADPGAARRHRGRGRPARDAVRARATSSATTRRPTRRRAKPPRRPAATSRRGRARIPRGRVHRAMPDTPTSHTSLAAGRYELLDQLGEGGMATVWRAVDHKLAVLRAVKVMKRLGPRAASLRARFEREAHIMADLDHPHVVPVHDIGEDDGQLWLVMSLLEHGSVAQRVARTGPLGLAEACAVGLAVLDALVAAHARGVVHRDIKPQNVLVDKRGVPRLADFGIARIEGDDRPTRTGAVLGTWTYMAPEQRQSAKEAGPAADLYALGATLVALCTGREPPELHNPATHAVVEAFVPEPLQAFVIRCTQYRPEDRFPDAATAMAELQTIAAGAPPPPPLPPGNETITLQTLSTVGTGTGPMPAAGVVPAVRRTDPGSYAPLMVGGTALVGGAVLAGVGLLALLIGVASWVGAGREPTEVAATAPAPEPSAELVAETTPEPEPDEPTPAPVAPAPEPRASAAAVAPAAPPPVETLRARISATRSYGVLVDGTRVGATPLSVEVTRAAHRLAFVAPDDGRVLVERTWDPAVEPSVCVDIDPSGGAWQPCPR
ncbi:MAG: sulfatase-like hydrolase/transferase [Myxococcota bacterium]